MDIECTCKNDEFLDSIACCIQDDCDDAGKDETIKFAKGICNIVGVEVPEKVECKTAATTTSASATGTGAAAAETETETPDAAPASLGGVTGAIGVAALLFAL